MVGEMVVGEMVVGEMVVGTSAFIVWVKGQQAVQPVLLFTPAVTITSLQGDPSFSTIEVDKVKLTREYCFRNTFRSTGNSKDTEELVASLPAPRSAETL